MEYILNTTKKVWLSVGRWVEVAAHEEQQARRVVSDDVEEGAVERQRPSVVLSVVSSCPGGLAGVRNPHSVDSVFIGGGKEGPVVA